MKEVGGDGISLSLDGGSAIASGVSGTTELEGGGRPLPPPPLPYFLPTTNHLPPSTDYGFSQHTNHFYLPPSTHSFTHAWSIMSNLTRFYWAKLKGASNLFQQRKIEQDLDKVQDICCQLVVEPRCPPLCRIEACVSFIRRAIHRGFPLTFIETPLPMLPSQLLVRQSPASPSLQVYRQVRRA